MAKGPKCQKSQNFTKWRLASKIYRLMAATHLQKTSHAPQLWKVRKHKTPAGKHYPENRNDFGRDGSSAPKSDRRIKPGANGSAESAYGIRKQMRVAKHLARKRRSFYCLNEFNFFFKCTLLLFQLKSLSNLSACLPVHFYLHIECLQWQLPENRGRTEHKICKLEQLGARACINFALVPRPI